MPKSNYATDIQLEKQFFDPQNIRRIELTKTCRNYIKLKEQDLEKTCRKIWMAKNPLDESFIFGKFVSKGDGTIVTLASYVPRVGWITQR